LPFPLVVATATTSITIPTSPYHTCDVVALSV
jgi:hypothetical protein